MSTQDIIVYLIVFLCIIYAGKHFLKFFRKKDSQAKDCGCGCSGCCKAARKPSGTDKKAKK